MVRVKLYYESIGTGEPLVLLHAGVADSSIGASGWLGPGGVPKT
jgi:hypothetical protein